jgi:drug/metabolite transporter (DMT)-like permease
VQDHRADRLLLVVGVLAISTAGPIIREVDSPPLATAAWRNLLALPLLAAVVLVAHRRAVAGADARTRRLVAVAGLFLAAHFATWVPSIELTTVASSVALVCTQPVWVVAFERLRGRPVSRRTGLGVAVALAGVVLLTGVDVTVSSRALWGDLLALAGGAFAAGYVLAGAEARRVLPNPVYTLGCYGLAGGLLAAMALAGGQPMTGYDARTWWLLGALVVGPQLLGHSVFNRVLPSVGATVVSVAILLEVLGAALIAWWWSGEVPPLAAVPAAALLLAGLYLTVTGGDRSGPGSTDPRASPGSPPARVGGPGGSA